MIIGRITKKLDGSYLIDLGYGPNTFHAHSEATPAEYKVAEKYAKDNPDLVDYEIAPTDAEVEAKAIEEYIARIQYELEILDIKLPRAVEDLYTSTKVPMHESVKLVADKKSALRAELALKKGSIRK